MPTMTTPYGIPICIKHKSADILESRCARTPPYAARAGAQAGIVDNNRAMHEDVNTLQVCSTVAWAPIHSNRSRAAGLAASTRLKFHSRAQEVLNYPRVTELITWRSTARCRRQRTSSNCSQTNEIKSLVPDSIQDLSDTNTTKQWIRFLDYFTFF